MTAYDVSEWSDLFVAAAGAGAALAGLVFVAVSINIERILRFKGLPERALETVISLMLVVLISIICLMPGQSTTALGIELLAVWAIYTAAVVHLARVTLTTDSETSWLVSHMALRAIAIVPLLVGALSLLAESGGGLYWVAGAIVGATFGSVANAWVLLVEILR